MENQFVMGRGLMMGRRKQREIDAIKSQCEGPFRDGTPQHLTMSMDKWAYARNTTVQNGIPKSEWGIWVSLADCMDVGVPVVMPFRGLVTCRRGERPGCVYAKSLCIIFCNYLYTWNGLHKNLIKNKYSRRMKEYELIATAAKLICAVCNISVISVVPRHLLYWVSITGQTEWGSGS